MNILFTVPYVPSLVRARSYNLIRHLSARGHRITAATLWANDKERAEAEELKEHCDRVHAVRLPVSQSMLNCVRALPGSEPLQSAYSWSAGLLEGITALQAGADVMHVEHLRGARYALHAKAHQGAAGIPVVWDSVDCISYLFEQAVTARRDRVGRLVNRLELSRTRRYEGWLWRQFDRVLITSDADKKAITALEGGSSPRTFAASVERAPRQSRSAMSGSEEDRITVLPNGVDTRYFAPTNEPRQTRTLVFSGKMSYHANVSAATHLVNDIMPLVWARVPDVRLVIVGKNPPRIIRTLAARHPDLVTVTGTVSDVRPFLRTATAAVIPLTYGAGSQFKVLEAMACATPVVASMRAVSALETRAGRDVLVAAHAEAFAHAVIDLLASPQRQREIGEAGRRYVDGHHRWDEIAGRLEAIYEDVIAERGQARRAPRGSLLSA